jgi:DNA-binding NtrC family response regulator
MGSPDHRLSPPTVLVVDDDDLLRWFMTRVLEDQGYRVVPAENGRVAWELLRRDAESFDAVVTDVVMPMMDGVELAARIAALANAPPLVLVSAYPYHHAVLDHPFLPKPFHPEQLVTVVGRILGAMERRKVGS